jgi:hypothetical protein
MKLEVITLCDAAQIYEGKLSILGAFDSILAPELPFKLQQFSLAAKVRFTKDDKLNRKIKVEIELPDKSIHERVIRGEVSIGSVRESSSIPFVMNFVGFSFEQYGMHEVRFSLDDEIVGTYEFQVTKAKKSGR